MSEDLCRIMLSYKWPGNVRELRNVIERMRLMNSDKLYYEVDDIGLPAATQVSVPTPTISTPEFAHPRARPVQAIPVARSVTASSLRKGRSPMRRLETLRALFKEHGTLTRSEIIGALEVSPNIATSDLKTLAAEGLIQRIQPSKSPRSTYFKLIAAEED
jgi:DNA-binding NtrC family response regulator